MIGVASVPDEMACPERCQSGHGSERARAVTWDQFAAPARRRRGIPDDVVLRALLVRPDWFIAIPVGEERPILGGRWCRWS